MPSKVLRTVFGRHVEAELGSDWSFTIVDPRET